jgi:hypothetical protein
MKRYTLDPDQMDLEQFIQLTRSRKMLPSRIELHQQMDFRFGVLRQSGIAKLGELLRILGSKTKLEGYSEESGLSVDYLVLLKREAGSYLARPFPLSGFPGIPFEYTEILKSKGFANTRDFFEKVQSDQQQAEVSTECGIPLARLKELHALCDLSRITGVGGVFARVVHEAGIRSAREFADTDANTHFRKYKAVIDKYGYAAGHFSEEDIQYCIDYSRVIAEADQNTAE